mgnify:CR=1 FL=1
MVNLKKKIKLLKKISKNGGTLTKKDEDIEYEKHKIYNLKKTENKIKSKIKDLESEIRKQKNLLYELEMDKEFLKLKLEKNIESQELSVKILYNLEQTESIQQLPTNRGKLYKIKKKKRLVPNKKRVSPYWGKWDDDWAPTDGLGIIDEETEIDL